jgi:hypothetical protein
MRQDIFVRSLPFAVYTLFLAIGGLAANHAFAEFDIRWLYPIKAVLVGAVLLLFIRSYDELRVIAHSRAWLLLGAPLVGAMVFFLWIHLDQGPLNLGSGIGYDPRDPATGSIDWRLAAFRLASATLIVPIMEELFWRSFIMRWIDRHDFLTLSPNIVSLRAILVSSIVFGFAHSLWFAGILAGLAYAWLYRVSGSLWVPVLAHAITNAILGIWVLQTGSWQFW